MSFLTEHGDVYTWGQNAEWGRTGRGDEVNLITFNKGLHNNIILVSAIIALTHTFLTWSHFN